MFTTDMSICDLGSFTVLLFVCFRWFSWSRTVEKNKVKIKDIWGNKSGDKRKGKYLKLVNKENQREHN